MSQHGVSSVPSQIAYFPIMHSLKLMINCCILIFISGFNEKKCSEETQTVHTGGSKAEPKIFARRRPPSRVAGQPKFNQLEMAFTYKPSLVRIDAHNFELLW